MKSRSIKCMKIFLTGFNVICILFAIVVIALCGLDLRTRKTNPEDRTIMSSGAAGFLITVGLLLGITAIVGCVGAIREGTKTLYTYAGFIIFLICVELTVGVGVAVFRSWAGAEQNPMRQQFFRNVTSDSDARHFAFWDKMQIDYECCGLDGPSDYSILHRDIPAACCPRAHPLHEGRERKKLHNICIVDREYYPEGCEKKITERMNKLGNFYIGIAVFFGLIEVLCTVLALWMARTIKMERKKLQQNLQSHFES